MQFAKLDDSPMFRKQIQCMEESAESLRERSLKFYKGCRKYTEGLGEAYDGDIAYASALETFGGGHNDPISVAFGGPVMTKFTIALREIGTYKEVLRSQVEHMLNDRLLQFVNIDLQEVKEARKRFDKASLIYDQTRERFLSLRKGTKSDVANALEEELHIARNTFEQARFNLVTALSNVEAKKRFEFLEAVSGTMDAHLRYFKQGYELLHQMEPYINQVLTYAQQSRERSNYEQAALNERMQEYKRQIDRESRWASNGSNGSPNGDGIQAIGRSSHKMIEAVMQSAAKGKVQTIRQGYLSKRSSNLRGDWKRRFFVLDSRGMLYYYRKQLSKSSGSSSQHSGQRNSSELGSGLLSRWLSSHHHGGVHDEKSVARHTVNLLTSTIKVDADQSDLRFCFRIISPTKNYTLQAESALDQMDWIEKITGVIASLLSSQIPERLLPASPMGSGHNRSTSESSSFESSDFDHAAIEEVERNLATAHLERPSRSLQQQRSCTKSEKPIDVLRKVCGNDRCADCGAPEPDWASLNLGVLVCIECSGVHRNLGVHISKVRSLTLDVKVWEPSVISLFQSLGNTFANSVWEELLQSRSAFQVDASTKLTILRRACTCACKQGVKLKPISPALASLHILNIHRVIDKSGTQCARTLITSTRTSLSQSILSRRPSSSSPRRQPHANMSSKLIPSNPDEVMVIRDVTPNITTFSVPFYRFGTMKIGGRGTLVRMTNGELAVFSPVALTESAKAKVTSQGGNVRYIVALDYEHHIFLSEWKKEYPSASLIGPEGLPEKRAKQADSDPKIGKEEFATVFTKEKKRETRIGEEFDRDFEYEYVDGHANKEIAFLHRPDSTLIQADLMFNLPCKEQFSKVPEAQKQGGGFFARMFEGMQSPAGDAKGIKRFNWYMAAKDKPSFNESIKRIDTWDFKRMIPCHGEVMETDGKDVFRKVFEWHLAGKK